MDGGDPDKGADPMDGCDPDKRADPIDDDNPRSKFGETDEWLKELHERLTKTTQDNGNIRLSC